VGGGFSTDYSQESANPGYVGVVYHGASTPGPGSGSRTSTLSVGRPKSKDGAIGLTLTCSTGRGCGQFTVKASIVQTVSMKVKGHRRSHRVTVVLAKQVVTLSGGHHSTINLKLNRTGRQLLAARHRLRITVTITVGKKVKQRYTVLVTQPRPAKRHHRK
jgi:hypothetical protein